MKKHIFRIFVCLVFVCGVLIVSVKLDIFNRSIINLHNLTFLTTEPVFGRRYLPELDLLHSSINFHPKCANANTSRIYLKHYQPSYSLGEQIKVQIDLFDRDGNRKSTGGDHLRVWMEDPKTSASVSGEVFDHNDGSYTGVFKATWAGKAVIRVFIATRREELALYYRMFKQYSSIWTAYADFNKKPLSETSRCSANQPSISKTNEWCNLTTENDGFPWFCKKTNLTCDTWTNSYTGPTNFTLDTTEKDILTWSVKGASSDILRLFLNISIRNVGNSSLLTPPDISCNNLPAKVTWQQKSPNGYFYTNKWHSLMCHDTLPRTIDAYRQCLKGRTLWLHGDSTSAQFKTALHSFLRFPSHADAHVPVIDKDPLHNFSVSWHAHELPFYHGARHYPRYSNQAQHIMMDRLPNTTKDIVVLYLYVHFTLGHPDEFRRHVRRLVPSAKNLLARAPNVTLAVRGPHAYFRGTQSLISYWGLIYSDIWHEEFASLHDKIVYLDFWDLTMARPSADVHADMSIVHQMVHKMMSLLCFRK
ncbi:NXPE family member 3-like [Haliotis cracherodii]|uniref:NXPE family member 3-like n=1 Tax=Haliotis cracherodii TaxID=6455 RepID=UPI0039ED704F